MEMMIHSKFSISHISRLISCQEIHWSVTNLQVPAEKQNFQDETGGAAACADQKLLSNGKKL